MFFEEYSNEILSGIRNMIVTNESAERIGTQEAMDIWARRAKALQEERNGLIFFCGNGASATMAEHMSHDWFQNGKVNTTTCAETAHITAISNDLSYDEVFSYRIGRILSEQDMLVTISSSGNSTNIIRALQTAREKKVYCITFSGKSEDNLSRKLGNLNFYVPLDSYGLVESAHAVVLHGALDNFLEKYMGGKH
jgi:D-sedoheptulose 7-phosphate isomerase